MISRCIGFLIGLSCLFWLQSEKQTLIILLLSLMVLISVLFISWFRVFVKRLKPLMTIVLGLFWGAFSAYVWLSTVPSLLSKPEIVNLKGYICSLPTVTEPIQRFGKVTPKFKDVRFNFCVTQLNGKTLSFYQANKLKLSYYHASPELVKQLLGGTYWQFLAKLKPIHGRLNPGGFDYEKWLVSEGFIGTGYVKQAELLKSSFSIKAQYHQVRQSIYQHLNAVVTDSEFKGMIMALAIGERNEISPVQWQAVKGSGTSHLLAISGLHIGIAALWSYYCCLLIVTRIRFITAKIPAQKVAQIAALIGALSITLLSGLGYPAQRALLMLSIFMLVKWSGRQMSLANVLALSVIIILLIQPFAIITISFWLSVFAVAVIVFLLSYRHNLVNDDNKIKAWLRINWFLFIALMPITWLIFDSVSVVAFVANLLLIPLTSFLTTPLVYLGLLSLLFSTPISSGLFFLADKLIWFSYQIQLILSDFNQEISVSSVPMSLLILIFLATFILLLPNKFPLKKLLLPIVLICTLTILQPKVQPAFKMVIFDIGQGLAIHISVDGKNILYDTGYGNKSFSMAESSLLPYFKRQNISVLDKLIISHGDSDHSGGFNSINNQLNVKQLIVGEKLKYNENKAEISCHLYEPWQWGDVRFSFLTHLNPLNQKSNNRSCVLSIEVAGQKILLTGDIEKKAEKRLLQNGIKQHNIIVVAHHGSKTSSTSQFVNKIKAKIAIYSTGYANQWNFPKQQILDRFTQSGTNNYITHQNGAVIIQLDEEQRLKITTERTNRSHFWHFKQLAN